MTPTKNLEEQLRSWKLRHASPNVERRLFGTRRVQLSLPKLAGILTPLTACVLVAVSTWRQIGQPMLHDGETQTAIIAMSMSNQNFAPYLATSFKPEANRLDTFGWTNRGVSKSSVDSFTPSKATDL